MEYSENVSSLLSDRKEFDRIVYTPLNEAVIELSKRWGEYGLNTKIEEYLAEAVPDIFKTGFHFVIFRHLCTPNFEMHRFISASDAFSFKPVFGEYPKDKFTSNNENKYFLGKLGFHFGYGKKGGQKVKYVNVINFNDSNGKPINSINTLWGESLVDFHRNLFLSSYPQFNDTNVFFDSSEWFKKHGGSPKEYYKKFLVLFIQHGILFENFILDDQEEMNFAKEAFLPAFFEVWEKMGKKPLIVALEPTEIEGDDFWLKHPGHLLDIVLNKLRN